MADRDREIRPGILRRFRLAVHRTDRARAEMDEEIRLHLRLRAAQLEAQGLDPAAARAEAERRFGPLDEARERLHGSAERREHAMRLREWAADLARDVRHALRTLRRAPGFVAVAVACIALGVGANAAAFAVLDELLLRPLPVPAPERLVNLAAPGPKPGTDQCNVAGPCDVVFSHPMLRDLERAAPAAGLAGVAAHRLFMASITPEARTGGDAGSAVGGEGLFVSGAYFPVLGVRPALGRLLAPSDDAAGGAQPVAVVSHDYWTAHLGGDPGAIGRRITVNDQALTVVGVAPRDFAGTTLGVRPRVWVPLRLAPTVDPYFGPASQLDERRMYWLYLFARLQPGATRDGARAALDARYRAILADVEAPLQRGLSEETLARFLAKPLVVEDGRHGQSMLREATRLPLTFLFALTGLVVLIASANVANLLLARGVGRGPEMAVRLSLGAGRRRLVRQLLVESCVLAALGGAASLLVAHATVALISSFLPAASLGIGVSLTLGLRPSAVGFAALLALGTGLLFGLFPALHATRPDLVAAIRAGAGQLAGGDRAAARFRAGLVVAQLALSLALLASAGLFVRSVRTLGDVPLGLDPDGVVTFALVPGLTGYDGPRARALFDRLERELAAVPGVAAVSGSNTPLLVGASSGGNVRVEGFARGPDTDANARFQSVGPDYFRALGIPLLAGRPFTEHDRAGAPQVAVVSEAFVRKFGLEEGAVGRRLALDGDGGGEGLDIEIVGVMRDARYSGVKDAPPPLVVRPWRQDDDVMALAFYARTARPAADVLRDVRAVVARHDRALPLELAKPFAQQVRENVYLDRMIGTLAAAFAALATLLAVVGLYGVLAYTVAQRGREIGIRMALGADTARVRALVLRQVARLLLAGGAIGVAGALALGRATRSLLYATDATDPLVVAGAAALLALAAFAAGWVPAWRASRVSPVEALRDG